MRLAIVGSRNFEDWLCAHDEIDKMFKEYPIDTIVSGGAKGADSMGRKYARGANLYNKRYKYLEFLPNWEKYGKPAGMIRNREIISNSDVALVFWDGISKGTKNSIDLIMGKKIPYKIIMFKEEDFDSEINHKKDVEYMKGYSEWI